MFDNSRFGVLVRTSTTASCRLAATCTSKDFPGRCVHGIFGIPTSRPWQGTRSIGFLWPQSSMACSAMNQPLGGSLRDYHCPSVGRFVESSHSLDCSLCTKQSFEMHFSSIVVIHIAAHFPISRDLFVIVHFECCRVLCRLVSSDNRKRKCSCVYIEDRAANRFV